MYPFASLESQRPIEEEELPLIEEARQQVRNLLEQRERYIHARGLSPAIWLPAANWRVEQAFYAPASALLAGDRHTAELLRLYSQQFTGCALWCMSRDPGQPLAPEDRAAIEENLSRVVMPEGLLALFTALWERIPGYLHLSPPLRFGEVGWLVRGVLLNLDTVAYWERLVLLYEAGLLDRGCPTGLKAGSRVLEIGGGYGGLAWYLQEAIPNLRYTMVDLPESLIYSATYLNVLHPRATRFLANYQFQELVEGQEQFDLIINTLSMSEMTEAQVRVYCEGIPNLLASGGVFFEQNQDNTSVGMLNASQIVAEYLRRQWSHPGVTQGCANSWVVG